MLPIQLYTAIKETKLSQISIKYTCSKIQHTKILIKMPQFQILADFGSILQKTSWSDVFLYLYYILLITNMVVESWNRRFGCETIHWTKKFTSMNLMQMSCVITYAYLFLTSMEAVRGLTPYSDLTLWHCNSTFGSSHRASSAYQKK